MCFIDQDTSKGRSSPFSVLVAIFLFVSAGEMFLANTATATTTALVTAASASNPERPIFTPPSGTSALQFVILDPGLVGAKLTNDGKIAEYLYTNILAMAPGLVAWEMNPGAIKTRFPKAAVEQALTAIAANTNLISGDPDFPYTDSDHLKNYDKVRQRKNIPIAMQNQIMLLDFFSGSIALTTVVKREGLETKSERHKKDSLINEISDDLDQADQSAEEWGRATISDIAFIDNTITTNGNGYFALNYTQPTGFYMTQAMENVQGNASLYVSKQTSVGLVAQYSPGIGSLSSSSGIGLPGSSLGVAPTNQTAISTNALSPASTTNSAPTPSTNSSPLNFAATNVTAVTTVESNSQPQAAQSVQPQLAQSTVLKIGASDKETELILDYMTDPVKLPDNKRAYIGVMQVSVLPGWRTRKGYIGEVQVSFRYALSKKGAQKYFQNDKLIDTDDIPDWILSGSSDARNLGLAVTEMPTVISAFPFADSQILDLSSSLQKQISFLAQIQASIPQVPGLAASLSTTISKLTQQALNTRTSLPLVVPSSSGAEVTYRFDPEVQALVEPWNSGSGPGQVLEPSSFPALVVIICEENELLTWDSVSASVETRWIPESRRHWFKKYAFDPWFYGVDKLPEISFSNRQRLRNARLFDEIIEKINQMGASGFNADDYAFQEAVRRFDNVKTAAMGRTLDARLPLVKPHVTAIVPDQVRWDLLPRKIFIQGRYFNSAFSPVEKVVLNGMLLPFTVDNDGHFITATISPALRKCLAPGQYNIEVSSSAGKTIWTGAGPGGFTVLPVPAPAISAVVSQPIREYLFGHEPQYVDVQGANFYVHDNSLSVTVNGVNLGHVICQNNDSLVAEVDPKRLHLKPGTYDLAVATSGGRSVLSNAVSVVYEKSPAGDHQPPLVQPIITSIVPGQFRVDFPQQLIRIFGDNFELRQGVQSVRIGSVNIDSGQFLSMSDHSITVTVPPGRLIATNYDVEVVNKAGSTVSAGAVQVLPVPPPLINNVYCDPLVLINDSTNVSSGTLTILGSNFLVNDDSLKVALGGVLLKSITTGIATGNSLISAAIDANTLKPLKPGRYNVTVITSGGSATATNAITVVGHNTPPSPNMPVITDVFPKHGFAYSTSVFAVSGSNFETGYFHRSIIAKVLIGSRDCHFSLISDNTFVVTVPPWAKTISTNEGLVTNKFDVTVIGTTGTATLTNAISFDLSQPIDSSYPYPLTPDEEKLLKALPALFYTAYIEGTNPVINTTLRVSASAGSQQRSAHDVKINVPNVSADVHIGDSDWRSRVHSAGWPKPATNTNSSDASP